MLGVGREVEEGAEDAVGRHATRRRTSAIDGECVGRRVRRGPVDVGRRPWVHQSQDERLVSLLLLLTARLSAVTGERRAGGNSSRARAGAAVEQGGAQGGRVEGGWSVLRQPML
jgi:hypothetical protein